ncbi:MAG: hypothetical protein E6176_00845 [Clostridium celatum]|uniref:hypothetical protein n=1 Tax=Clostridium sp. TaxID=1506 RepID=UPI0025C2F4BB|nr:hypothetical protein [Clostridium sp.]MBS4957446.1 hypothetical protein [Clostridium sp.]MDU4884218.1 hypothetical protein [Clostridium celatum]MDU5260963.1 hypothetical protein [Clostridium celatum]MDU7077427.1 hypothetical protein [Clostridium celatum]
MNKCNERVKEERYGVVITLVVMIISALLSRSYLNQYFDVILGSGVFLVIGGFIYSIIKIDNIKMGQTVIIGGIATMLLSCVL